MSHASEEKKMIAEPLTGELEDIGVSVWMDKKQIQAGDRIYERIDEGLRHARHGIVILSKAFFSKPWAKSELAALFNKESNGQIVLIPVLYDLTFPELREASALMAGRLVISWSEGVEAVASKIADIVRRAKDDQPAMMPETTRIPLQVAQKDLVLIVSQNVGTGFFEILDLRMDGTMLSIDVAPANGQEEGQLRNISKSQYGNIMVAYGYSAHEVRVGSFQEVRRSGRAVWILNFRVQEKKDDLFDMDYNGISADKQAELRAGWILLGRKPNMQFLGPGIMGQMLADSITKGSRSRFQITAPPLIGLYATMHEGNRDLFLPYARLVAAMFLVQSNTVGNIHRLNLSLSGNQLSVDFEGERPRRYQNHIPEIISVVGTCDLRNTDEKKPPRTGIATDLFG